MRAVQLLGAVFDLNGRASYVHWHFFEMSVANLAVIGAMLVVFALAIMLPFPGSGRARARRRGRIGDGRGGGAGAHAGGRPAGGGVPGEPGARS